MFFYQRLVIFLTLARTMKTVSPKCKCTYLIPSEISLSRGASQDDVTSSHNYIAFIRLTGVGERKSFNTTLTPGGALYFHELIVEARNSAFCRTRVA